MITGLLLVVLLMGALFMLLNARSNVRAELESTASLALHLLDREILAYTKASLDRPQPTVFQLSSLSHIRHLRIEFFDNTGQLLDSNQLNKTLVIDPVAPTWFVRLMVQMSPVRSTIRDVSLGDLRVGQLVVTPDPRYEIEETWDDTKDLLALVFVFFLAVNFIVYRAIDHALKPVNKILKALTSLEHGKYATRLPSFELSEMESISVKFNHMASKLEESIKRNLGLSRQIIQLEEVERKNLARDLHDEIGQSITAINVDAQAIVNVNEINTATIHSIQTSARAILNVSKKMMGITHQIMDKLRPDTLDKLGLKIALEDLLASWQQKLVAVKCKINFSGDFEDIPEDIAIIAYRAVQEGLTNIARYAQATLVSINVIRDEECLTLMIEDNGVGFNVNTSLKGYGLMGMRERIEGMGGEFELDSELDNGTRLVVRLPINMDEREQIII